MLKHQHIKTKIWQNKCLFGRTILSALLLVLVLLNSVPLREVLASDTMDCCKGLAHAADSCAGGSCPMSRRPKPKQISVEKFCGTKKLLTQPTFLATLQELRKINQSIFPNTLADDLSEQSKVPRLDTFVAASSCASNCCVSSSNRNHRSFIALSEVVGVSQKPRPPTASFENNFPQYFVKILKTVHRECKPRAPPQISS